MSDIRERCPISCIAHEEAAYTCDSGICLKHKAYEQGRADEIDDVIKKLAESEDTILSDRQYYTLMELKEQK